MRHVRSLIIPALLLLLISFVVGGNAVATRAGVQDKFAYLAMVDAPEATPVVPPEAEEFRALWVTRFDWTSAAAPAGPSKIDEIVDTAGNANFNVLLFQVRGTADALYTPGLEPWSRLVSGATGQPPDPYWDPLAYMIQQAHARDIEVHAYFNVYPVWDCANELPAESVSPRHFYYLLRDRYGQTGDRLNGLQWRKEETRQNEPCIGSYLRATPASAYADTHMLAVAADIISRYDIDGLHLDHIRYGSSDASCDPISSSSSGVTCFGAPPQGYLSYDSWQRAQVNGTVWKFYDQILNLDPDMMLSAAVWPVHSIQPEWPGDWSALETLEGYDDYYQDSKEWIQQGYIDAIMPMIYNWYSLTRERYTILVNDFQADSGGRFVIPGIIDSYSSFDEIAYRIAQARAAGTAGQAIFSYSGLRSRGYFDDLLAGPYAQPALVPDITWRTRRLPIPPPVVKSGE